MTSAVRVNVQVMVLAVLRAPPDSVKAVTVMMYTPAFVGSLDFTLRFLLAVSMVTMPASAAGMLVV